MSELTMNLEENKAKPKSIGYVSNRLATALSIVLVVVLFFAILSSIGRVSFGSICVLVAIELILVVYVRKQFRSTKLMKLIESMKVNQFYMPADSDEQVVRAQKCYFGIDFKTGIVGIGTVYEIGANKQKRLYFDTDMVESYERLGNQLALSLRNRAIPALTITVLDGNQAYRCLEMACKMRGKYDANRSNDGYQNTKAQMIAAGWMIERDY